MDDPPLQARLKDLVRSIRRKMEMVGPNSSASETVKAELLKELDQLQSLLDEYVVSSRTRKALVKELSREAFLLVLRWLGDTWNWVIAPLGRRSDRCLLSGAQFAGYGALEG
jgi:hypothetical protein